MNDQRDGNVEVAVENMSETVLAKQQEMDNAVVKELLETQTPIIIQPSPLKDGTTIYLTDGELIPWKKTWWKVQLREIDVEKIVTLVKGNATAKSQKRSLRVERWNTKHSRKAGVKREVAAMSRLVNGAGRLSGLVDSPAASLS